MKALRPFDDPTCADAREELSRRHDGLAPAHEARLARHLAGCADCARFERGLAELVPLFDSLRALEPPAGLLAGVTAAHARGPAAPRAPLLRFCGRAAAAALGFVAVSALGRLPARGARAPEPAPLALLARAGRTLQSRALVDSLPERAFLNHVAASEEQRR